MTFTATARLTRAAEFLLVRLLAPVKRPPPPARLRQELGRLLREPFDGARWEALLGELAEAGLITRKPLELTEAGRAQALDQLGLKHLPPRATWRTLRDRYLVPRALGSSGDDGVPRSRLASMSGLGAWLLRRRYGLPAGSAPTLNAAMEALACRQLGFREETRLSDVRDRVLARLLQVSEPLRRDELAPQIVQAAAGAQRPDLASLREAVLRDWLTGSQSPGPEEPFDLPAFAATVQAAARTCPTGRFGDNKVFIHHVWKRLQAETHLPVRSLEEFKERLVEANRADLLRLSRADLVQAMDPADVERSETRYLGSLFHFILMEGGRP